MSSVNKIVGTEEDGTVGFQVFACRDEDGRIQHPQAVAFHLLTPQRVAELNELLRRALNCMDNPPAWAVSYMDFVTNTPTPPKVPPVGPPHPNNAELQSTGYLQVDDNSGETK